MVSIERPNFRRIFMLSFGTLLLCLLLFPWTTVSATDAIVTPEAKAIGLVESMPEGSLAGGWTIGGVTYSAGERTQFRQHNGPLMEGACVEVSYSSNSMPYTVSQIRTHDAEKCAEDSHSGEDAGDDEDGDTDEEEEAEQQDGGTSTMPERKTYGEIETLPESADFTGTWTIEGIQYIVTAETDLEQEHGAFEVNSCVKVNYSIGDGEARIASEIETQSAHKCSRDETAPRGHGIVFGIVQSYPEGLVGEWNVGGMTVVADDATTFKSKVKVDFKVGVIVKVRFTVEADETYRAVAIESKFRHASFGRDESQAEEDDDGDIDDDDGLRGHAFGEIETLPTDLTGEWVVSGITYTATSETSYIQSSGLFTDGGSVRINYLVDDAGNRVAKVIKSTKGRNRGVMKLIGYLNARPANGFTGEWTIDGVTVETDLETDYDEGNGLVAQHSFIEVEYTINPAGKRRVLKITVHVPPEAGDNDSSGTISEMSDDSDVRAAAIENSATWTINGQNYVVTDATEVDESGGELGVGTNVSVNSYTAEDGSEVATQIRARNVLPIVFIPLLR